MKSPTLRFLLGFGLTAAAAFAAQPNRSSSPTVITIPAVPDGSVASRAPFPASRPFDDVKRPDGLAIDNTLPPNTPATTPQSLPAPAPTLAILQPQSPMTPGTSLTGRATAGVSTPLDAARVGPTLQAAVFSSREETLNDIENRVRASEASIAVMKRSVDQMSAAGRDLFHAANAEANSRAKALKRTVRQARDASEANWESIRGQLASDYSAFAEAMGRIDASAGISPAR